MTDFNKLYKDIFKSFPKETRLSQIEEMIKENQDAFKEEEMNVTFRASLAIYLNFTIWLGAILIVGYITTVYNQETLHTDLFRTFVWFIVSLWIFTTLKRYARMNIMTHTALLWLKLKKHHEKSHKLLTDAYHKVLTSKEDSE